MVNKTLDEAVANLPFEYKSIDPKHGWDEDFLYSHLDRLKDIKEYRQRHNKNPLTDIGAGKDLCKVAFGGQNGGIYHELTPQLVAELGKRVDENGSDKVVEYTKNNLDSILDVFDEKGLMQLVMDTPLYLIDEKKHDEAVYAIRNCRGMNDIAKEGDINKMRDVVQKSLQNPNCPLWAVRFASYAINNNSFVQMVFTGELQKSNYFMQKAIRVNGDAKGELDRDEVKRLIKRSIAEAEYEWKEELDPSDHDNVWKINERPFSTIALHAYPALKKKYEEDHSEEYDDKNERAERRHRKLMPF